MRDYIFSKRIERDAETNKVSLTSYYKIFLKKNIYEIIRIFTSDSDKNKFIRKKLRYYDENRPRGRVCKESEFEDAREKLGEHHSDE